MDEPTRECLAIDVSRQLASEDVLERLSDLLVRKGVPDHIRSDNGSKFTAKRVREWLERVGVKNFSIGPGSPWQNGYVESFNGKLRDELVAREVFDALLEAKVLIERWRKVYNTIRRHSSLGYRPPALESHRPWSLASATPQRAARGDPRRATLVIEDGSIIGSGGPVCRKNVAEVQLTGLSWVHRYSPTGTPHAAPTTANSKHRVHEPNARCR